MLKRNYQEILNAITHCLEITLTPHQPALIPITTAADEASNSASLARQLRQHRAR
ncbi:MAG: hypothetical protein ACJA09_004004 [Alcanivorax sp.]|jgi:hypothetical protein